MACQTMFSARGPGGHSLIAAAWLMSIALQPEVHVDLLIGGQLQLIPEHQHSRGLNTVNKGLNIYLFCTLRP